MIYSDFLRPPLPFDLSADAYKDWLHVNVLDHATGSIALVNVSLHGAPGDSRSLAVGAALVHVAGIGWLGNLEIRGLSEAAIGPSSIGLERVAVMIDPGSAKVLASVRDEDNGFTLRLEGEPSVPPILVEERLAFGHGWISWYAVPRLSVSGTWKIGSLTKPFTGASAYHDHNWGRWHWGDDVGWEWGCFLIPEPGPAFVLSRVTDRDHRQCGRPSLTVTTDKVRRTFAGPSIKMVYSGDLERPLRRLPGALAALHQDRAKPRLPSRLEVNASDGIDRVILEFTCQAGAQLVTSDPIRRGYGFIHEMPGSFTFAGTLGGIKLSGQGLGILEHVD